MKVCKVDGCGRQTKTNKCEYCTMHYQRVRKYGKPGAVGQIKSKPLLERFEEKFIPEPNSGCWLWIANSYPKGYGQIKVKGVPRAAHRVSWELYNSPIPESDNRHDICVCHKCDTPSCVNPNHLFLGSQADNVADQARKGRFNPPRGERQGRSRLTGKDVLNIRADSRTHKEIALEYGVTNHHVSDIKHKRRWAHI